jgi:predicted dehydrogenase
VHLPNLQSLSTLYHPRAVVSATGSNAMSVARQFKADYSSTNYEDILLDPEVDVVLICTRHHLHAQQAISALKAGKHVYCEKPLAFTRDDLSNILACYDISGDRCGVSNPKKGSCPLLMVGYNRRFSPAAAIVKEVVRRRTNPLMVLYRVSGGYITPDNWIQGPEGGGRIIGEMCHMFDLFDYWVDAPIKSVNVDALRSSQTHVLSTDNVNISVAYEDGSICNLFYSALGDASLGKEYIEIFTDKTTITVDDFKRCRVLGCKNKTWSSMIMDKGHRRALEVFAESVNAGGSWPIELSSIIRTSELSIIASEKASGG